MNLRTNSLKGLAKYDTEWGYLYNNDCEICKSTNECIKLCKHRNLFKLYVMKIEKGVVRMKRICKNAKLATRGTARAVG